MSALPEPFAVRDARFTDLDGVAELEIGAPWRFHRVALSGGALVGYVFCAFAGGEVHVNKIAVSPSLRRQGVASALMDEVLAFAARVSAEEIYLEVRVSNRTARVFYAGLGFVEAGRRARYYLDGEDALVMVRKLPGPRRLDGPPAMKGDSGR